MVAYRFESPALSACKATLSVSDIWLENVAIEIDGYSITIKHRRGSISVIL